MRDNAITYTKGIAILMMVLGHACYSTHIETWVNMFDIPAFFFVSGYCFNPKYITSPQSFIRRKIKGIYWPFVKWTLVFILLHNVLFEIGIYNSHYGFCGEVSERYDLVDILNRSKNLLFNLVDSERLLGGYWFLPCLLVGSFVFFAVTKFSSYFRRKVCLIWIGTGIVFALSLLCNIHSTGRWIFNYRVFESATFILLGYIYKTIRGNKPISHWFVFTTFIVISLGSLFWEGAAVNVTWKHQIPFMCTATCGSISLLTICRWIEKSNIRSLKVVLNFIGNNTLTILTWHFSCFVIVSYVITLIYDIPYLRIGEFPTIVEYSIRGWWIAYFLSGTIGSLLLALCNKHIKSSWLKL